MTDHSVVPLVAIAGRGAIADPNNRSNVRGPSWNFRALIDVPSWHRLGSFPPIAQPRISAANRQSLTKRSGDRKISFIGGGDIMTSQHRRRVLCAVTAIALAFLGGAPLSAIEMTPELKKVVDGARSEGTLTLESPPDLLGGPDGVAAA